MRLYSAIGICLVCGLVGGCQNGAPKPTAEANLDAALVKTLNNIGVENAILTQHTLYPYHFAADAENLNELGSRDFAVLARHFMKHPGVLNIHKGQAGDELYKARVAYVTRSLKEAGVEADRVHLSDGMPGGSGRPSEQVVTILQKPGQGPTAMRLNDSGMGAR